jgi:nitric oxide dioxygenase
MASLCASVSSANLDLLTPRSQSKLACEYHNRYTLTIRMSNTLHDSLSVGDSLLISAPYGEFGAELGSKLDGPLVLLSAGVGQTPLLSMLNAHLEDAERQPISYITVARNAQVHAFRGHLRSVAEKHDNICVKVFYSAPAGSTPRLSYDFLGRLDLTLVKNCLHLDDSTTQYL